MSDLESRLPEMLRRTAATGAPPDDRARRTTLQRARRRRVLNASAAALAAIALVAGTVIGAQGLLRSTGTTPLDDETPSPSPSAPAIVEGYLADAVWPEVTQTALEEAQARADAGELDWRLDPVQTAAVFASDVLGWDPGDIRVEETGRPRAGTSFVAASNLGLGPGEGSAGPAAPETIVTLRQLARTDASGVWTVVGADSDRLDVLGVEEHPGGFLVRGRFGDVFVEWTFALWPIIDGVVRSDLGSASTTLNANDPDGTPFTAAVDLPADATPSGATIGLMPVLWDPEGTIVAADAFPARVTGVSGATGPAPTAPTGPTGSAEDLPGAVLATRDAIAIAAETRDWEALEALIDPDRFSYNFDDGSNPVPVWRGDPSVLDTLGAILGMPFTTNREAYPDVDDASPTVYIWPGLMGSDLAHLTAEEQAMLDELGITARDVQDMIDAFGGYVGPRTGIAEDGTWTFYAAGGD